MAVEMVAVVGGLVVVFMQQSLQYLNGLTAIFGLGQLAIIYHQVFVAGGDVASTGITHQFSPCPALCCVAAFRYR